MNRDLEIAIQIFRSTAGRYQRYERYYAGRHDLSFATEKFQSAFGSMFREFAMNLCPAIVDAVKDKLKIEGFGIGDLGFRIGEGDETVGSRQKAVGGNCKGGTTEPETVGGRQKAVGGNTEETQTTKSEKRSCSARREIERIWRGNRMAIRSGEVHKEALKCGDAYVIVWVGAAGRVTIYPQRADRMTVKYSEEMPGKLEWAAKWWQAADKSYRLNIFYPDRIEKYAAKADHGGSLPDVRSFADLGLGSSDFGFPEGERIPNPQSTIPNPYGQVPVFHFSNNSDVGSFGESELVSAIPIQDGMNKSILDMLVAMEYSAFRQRWIAGMEVDKDQESGEAVAPFKHGVERLWVATSTETKFGDFNTSDLEQFLKVKDGFRIDMASVTGTPLYYLMPQIRGFPSGESLRKAETRFLAKVRDRQEQFGSVWADAMSFALRLAGFPDPSVTTFWEDASPMNERDVLENLRIKLALGVPAEQVLREAGY